MKLGIFLKVFARPTLEESLDGVQAAGLEAVQLDLTAAGIDPATMTDADCERIRAAHATRGLRSPRCRGLLISSTPTWKSVAPGCSGSPRWLLRAASWGRS